MDKIKNFEKRAVMLHKRKVDSQMSDEMLNTKIIERIKMDVDKIEIIHYNDGEERNAIEKLNKIVKDAEINIETFYVWGNHTYPGELKNLKDIIDEYKFVDWENTVLSLGNCVEHDVVIKNAIIKNATISIQGGHLCVGMYLDYGDGSGFGFGDYMIYLPKSSTQPQIDYGYGLFVWRVMEIAGVSNWKELDGKPIRVKTNHKETYCSIGHITKDDWFSPQEDVFGREVE